MLVSLRSAKLDLWRPLVLPWPYLHLVELGHPQTSLAFAIRDSPSAFPTYRFVQATSFRDRTDPALPSLTLPLTLQPRASRTGPPPLLKTEEPLSLVGPEC